ncbi:glycosyltransferase [Fulvimarina endophytica]|uniref:Glycosyltransferase n=1 Tax=Fulvimarina endophytica TaxID=2293836 RepID=A0A371X560_9HYPH|nr:TIGR04282 family arsenosugar biosynthesis glycosyltransferase [Fulvimarina endophytica]RFC64349.1 glycosyltransferase [Fulvimarina endophytica]
MTLDPSRPTLVVFAKAPVLGTVKTRLAAGIGEAQALALYRHCLRRTVRELADPRWRTVLAVTPDGSAKAGDLWPEGPDRIAQGGGDLGVRMMRPLAQAVPEAPVVLVGSDIPGIGKAHVERAFGALHVKPMVFGPALDGGFYMVGARDRPPPDLFAGVEWSTDRVLAEVTARLLGDGFALIETLEDLDDLASLERHRAAGRLPASGETA